VQRHPLGQRALTSGARIGTTATPQGPSVPAPAGSGRP
jgi:hypothetical protein